MKACGTCSLTPVLALIGLVGLGFGGYNWVSTGCPLGSCKDSAAAVTVTSTTAKEGDCPLCPSHEVTTVALTEKAADCSEAKDCAAEAKGGDCCKGSTETCCQTMAAEKKDCSEAKSECPMKGTSDQTTAEKADEKPAEAPATRPS